MEHIIGVTIYVARRIIFACVIASCLTLISLAVNILPNIRLMPDKETHHVLAVAVLQLSYFAFGLGLLGVVENRYLPQSLEKVFERRRCLEIAILLCAATWWIGSEVGNLYGNFDSRVASTTVIILATAWGWRKGYITQGSSHCEVCTDETLDHSTLF